MRRIKRKGAVVAKTNCKKELSTENFGGLENFIEHAKIGKITLFKDKTERARQNLRNAGLIK